MDVPAAASSATQRSPIFSGLSTQIMMLSSNFIANHASNDSNDTSIFSSSLALPTAVQQSKWPQHLPALETSLQSTKTALSARLSLMIHLVQESIQDREPLLFRASSLRHKASRVLCDAFGSVSLRPNHLYLAAAILAAFFLLCCIVSQRYQSHRKLKSYLQYAAEHNCEAPKSAIRKSFFASKLHKLHLLRAQTGDILDSLFVGKFRQYGSTYALLDRLGRPVVVHTLDPANFNAVVKSSWQDYQPSRARKNVLYPLAQEGLLLTHGEIWHRNRKLIARRLDARRAKDVSTDEAHMQEMFKAIGPADEHGWTKTVNLLDLFHRMALDTSTEFLLGASADSQAAHIREAAKQAAMAEYDLVPATRRTEMSYNEAFETIRSYFSRRSKLGSLYWMADSFKYRRACRTLNKYAEGMISKAMASTEAAGDSTGKHSSLLDGLLQELNDPAEIRNLITDVFIAGQNMTGTMAAFVFAQLDAHPDIYQRLRREILDKFGTEDEPRAPITWANMQTCTTLQHVLFETLRHYPLVAALSRNTCRDTVLPRGGGPDGMQPIAVPKGAVVTSNVYLMHRREEEWGPDAWDFNPDRWVGKKFGTEYAPFGGGPRQCVGQQLSMTGMSFMTTRMLQRFDRMEAPVGQDNLVKGFEAVLVPEHSVKVRLRVAKNRE